MTLGEQLRVWREQAGLSQAEFADALGLKQQTVSSWERDLARPHASRASEIARVLELDTNVVLTTIVDRGDADRRNAAPAARRAKVERLSESDWKAIEPLIDQMLGKK